MKNIPIRAASVLLLALGLAACGGGDEASTSDGGSGAPVASSVTCETLQFASAAGVAVPTSGQWASFAGTYTAGATTVVLSASGGLTVNSVAIDVKSACYVTADSMIMISWGTANTVGAGNIMYDSHIDFRSSGISGIADGVVLSPAS
jgi:hypothetical protein